MISMIRLDLVGTSRSRSFWNGQAVTLTGPSVLLQSEEAVAVILDSKSAVSVFCTAAS